MNKVVSIQFDNKTVMALNKEKYALYAFQACQSSLFRAGSVVCWNKVGSFFANTTLAWQANYCGYFSTSKIAKQQVIFIPQPQQLNDSAVSGSTHQLELGQKLEIDYSHGLKVTKNNYPHTMTLVNNSKHVLSSGLSIKTQTNQGFSYAGSCVFYQESQKVYDVAPLNQVFLMIIPDQSISLNMVVVHAMVDGVLIDLNNNNDNQRDLSFSIDSGWYGLKSTDKKIDKGANLSNLLIKPFLTKLNR